MIERPGHDLEVIVKTHREIFNDIGLEGVIFNSDMLDPQQTDWHYIVFGDSLEERYPGLDWEYFVTKDDLIHWIKRYSESTEKKENLKAEMLHHYLGMLPNFRVMTPAAKWAQRTIPKLTGKFEYRADRYDTVQSESSCIVELIEKRGFSKSNTQLVNCCNISWGPVYPVKLLFNRFPNGETGFALFFDDEDVWIDINEHDARLLNRFFNNASDDVLDDFEQEKVQTIIQNAVRSATERCQNDSDPWEQVDEF